jgi:glucan phosphoethanolaminetransferase (alkaline phosphatase superfamily)
MKIATTSSTAPAPINIQAQEGMSPLDPSPVVDVVGLTATLVVWLSIVVVLPGSVTVLVSVRAGVVTVLAGSVTVCVSVVVVSAASVSFSFALLEPHAQTSVSRAMSANAAPLLRATGLRTEGAPIC